MEDCEHYRVELSAYLDGQLELKLKSDVQNHLGNCQGCVQELADLQALSSMLGDGMAAKNLNVPDIWPQLRSDMPSLCALIAEDFSAYIDNELTPQGQEGVNKHLKDCQECTVTFQSLSETSRLLSKGLELPIQFKVDLWPALKARLNEDCALIQSELSSFSDQEVVPLRHLSITKHLLDCPPCRDIFERISSVGEIIREAYKPALAENFDLWPAVKRELQVVPFQSKTAERQESKLKLISPRLFWSTAVAAAVLIFATLSSWIGAPNAHALPIDSEAYLIESAMAQPPEIAEAVVYDQNQ